MYAFGIINSKGIVSPVSPPNTGLFYLQNKDNLMAKKKVYLKESKIKISPFNDYWGKYNFYFLMLSIGFLIIGYYLMSIGTWESSVSLNISPIIIILAYLFLLPLTILIRTKSKKEASSVSGKSER